MHSDEEIAAREAEIIGVAVLQNSLRMPLVRGARGFAER